MDSEQIALESLTNRVQKLYTQVFTLHQPADTIQKPCSIIEESNCTLKEVEKRHSVVKQLWNKLPVLDEYLSTDFLDKIGVTDDVKKTLILASEDNLKLLSEQLKELKSLENVTNNQSLKAVPEHSKKLIPIVEGNIEQRDKLDELDQRIQQLLLAYNNVISTLSKQFMIWNNFVTQCELALDSDRDAIE